MAILASAQWWVRAGGNALNGGGFDAAIAGAGTNYCDQDAAQLSLTDFATSGAGSTTLTSATGGFTSQMVGNCIRIASGTNFQTGYYFVTVYTDANTVTLDRTPTSGGAGSGGTGRLGGAFATPWGSLSIAGGGFTAPAVASPLAAGHKINVRGGGSDDPGSADYAFPSSAQAQYPSPAAGSAGEIAWVGYNGRPRIDCGALLVNTVTNHSFDNFAHYVQSSAYDQYAVYYNVSGCRFRNVLIDANGVDTSGVWVGPTCIVEGCTFRNSGGTAAGTTGRAAIYVTGTSAGVCIYGVSVRSWRGHGIYSPNNGGYAGLLIASTIVASCGVGPQVNLSAYFLHTVLLNLTVFGSAGDGIWIGPANGNSALDRDMLRSIVVVNCVITESAGYGLVVNSALSQAENDAWSAGQLHHNAFWDNASGEIDNLSNSADDITLSADPFVDGANGDFSLNSDAGGGALLKGAAFPDF